MKQKELASKTRNESARAMTDMACSSRVGGACWQHVCPVA